MVENATMILVGDVFEEHTVRFLLMQCTIKADGHVRWEADRYLLSLPSYPLLL
jgi:hypothetical protein